MYFLIFIFFINLIITYTNRVFVGLIFVSRSNSKNDFYIFYNFCEIFTYNRILECWPANRWFTMVYCLQGVKTGSRILWRLWRRNFLPFTRSSATGIGYHTVVILHLKLFPGGLIGLTRAFRVCWPHGHPRQDAFNISFIQDPTRAPNAR